MIATKTTDGGLSIAVWNLVDPDQHGSSRRVELTISGASPAARVTIQKVDDDHGNVLPKYAAIGKPLDPTEEQVEQLNRETALPAPEQTMLHDGKLELTLVPNALVLIKIQP